ncbi:MAG: hypothetical protein WCK02_04610 [Bacteroidota bacterium]
MKALILPLLLAINLNISNCFSQESLNKENCTFAIRTSIIHYFTGEIPLSIEKFRKKNSYELGISIITPSQFWISNNNLAVHNYYTGRETLSRLYNKGFSLRAQYKFLLITEPDNSKFYISPRLVLRQTWKSKEKVHYPDVAYGDIDYFSIESDKQTIIALSFLVGKEYFIDNFTFDIYGGFGIRSNSVYDRYVYSNNVAYSAFGFYKVQPTLSLGIALGYYQNKKQ